MAAITSPGPTAYPTADPITGMTFGPTVTWPAGLGPTHPPLPPVVPPPVPPPAGPRPPWYQQKRYAFPLILLMLLVIIGLFGDHTIPAAPASAPAPVSPPAPGPDPAPAPVPALTTDDELAGTYYKGTFLVGTQIQPGTYSTQGPTTHDDGQWARLSNTTGEPTAVIAHGIVNGPTTVTILPTDAAFQTTGDVVWVRVQIPASAPAPAPTPQPEPEPAPQAKRAPASTLPTTFGDGTYLVGSQIAPGTYQTPGTTTEFGGGWSRLSGTTGEFSEIIAIESVRGPATMTVLPTDHAVKFVGEGITWTKIS